MILSVIIRQRGRNDGKDDGRRKQETILGLGSMISF